MKKTLILLLMIFLTTMIPTATAQAQTMPDFSDIDTEVDTWLNDVMFWQLDYRQNHPAYYQMLWSHADAPDYQTPASPDYLGTGPDDQGETGYNVWLDNNMPGVTAYRLKIDTYKGVNGEGFVVVLETTANGEVWQKAINFGNETYRGHAWQMIPTELF